MKRLLIIHDVLHNHVMMKVIVTTTLKIKFLILLLYRADNSGLKVKVYSNNQFDLLDSTQIGLSQN